MSSHFVRDLEIRNFKCFKDLKLNGIKRVNLIGGKNNIGKTSFLEGIELFVSSENVIHFAYKSREIILRRQKNKEEVLEIDFFHDDSEAIEFLFNDNKADLKFSKHIVEEGKVITDTKLDEISSYDVSIELFKDIRMWIGINDYLKGYLPVLKKAYQKAKININLIKANTIDEEDIAILYGQLVNLNKEDFLNDSLKLFDENILALKQIATENGIVLKLSVRDRELPVLLSSFGDGINRFIAILCAIWASKDGFLFIDEIENGIHFTNYKKLWKIIFEASKMANCQVFTTSHSKECIEAFNEVNKDDEGLYLEFYRNKKTNLITARKKDFEQLEYELTHGGRIRGE